VVALTNDADARRKKARADPPPAYTSAMELGTEDRMAAIADLESALSGEAASEDRPWLMLAAGEQRRLAGDAAVARAWFQRLSAEHPEHSLQPSAKLGLALLNADKSLSGNVVATLQLLEGSSIPPTMDADRYRLLALDGIDQGSTPGRISEYVRKAVAHATVDPSVEARVKITLADLLTEDQDADLDADPDALPSLEADALQRAREALAAGRHSEASRLAQQLLDTWPDSEHAREAGYILQRAETGDRVVAGKVGVLLPKSGDYSAIGQRIEQVVRLANDRAGGRLTLVFRDAHGDSEGTSQLIEELVIDEGCVAILGPLLKEDVMEAAQTAQALGVPLVALSQSQTPTEAGAYVYRGFMPVEQQVAALVEHAMGDRGMSSFGVMFPDTGFGKRAAAAFEAAVEKQGGSVVRKVGYNPAETDFRADAKRLGDKDYSARAAEFSRLKRAAVAKGMDPSKVVLPPSIDFDAIFIPDSWQRVGLVASSLAYEEFPVGDFRPNRHAKTVPLLGLNAWHDRRIIENGGDYVQNSVFVDAFSARSGRPGVSDFVAEHRSALGRPPSVIDALAWDATHLLADAVVAGGPDRTAVRDELAQVRLSAPVAGGGSFGDDREVSRNLLVLTIDGNTIREWTPPALDPIPETTP
jgi:ABC-type branched-subunit amino acid transport system substrate-binding protein